MKLGIDADAHLVPTAVLPLSQPQHRKLPLTFAPKSSETFTAKTQSRQPPGARIKTAQQKQLACKECQQRSRAPSQECVGFGLVCAAVDITVIFQDELPLDLIWGGAGGRGGSTTYLQGFLPEPPNTLGNFGEFQAQRDLWCSFRCASRK